MATYQDISQLGRQLGNVSIDWVVCGCPVVALFKQNKSPEEQEHLGQPFGRNGESDTLRLWIGLDEKAGHALVTLTQRLSSNNKGRLLYLIVPSESLAIKVDAPAYWTLSEENIPSTIMDQPSDDKSSHEAKLLRMSFKLGSFAHGRVIMPSSQVTTQIAAQRLSMLRKLKALSQVTDFDLFTNYHAQVAHNLLRTQTLLSQGRIATPSISLTGLYPGSRDAVYDRWEHEGLCDDMMAKKHPKRALSDSRPLADKRVRYIAPTDDMLCPPPYAPSAPQPIPPAVVGDPSAAIALASAPAANPCPSVSKPTVPLHLQIPAWLTYAWSMCPKAHYIFVAELLALCAASLDHDIARFDQSRVAANTALLSHWAAELHKKYTGSEGPASRALAPCSVDKHIVSAELPALLSWLSILDRQADLQSPLGGQADLELSGNLKALALARCMFLNSNSHNEDKHYEGYVNARAWFVTKACLRLGASVLRRDKDIQSRMLREMERVDKENRCHECPS